MIKISLYDGNAKVAEVKGFELRDAFQALRKRVELKYGEKL